MKLFENFMEENNCWHKFKKVNDTKQKEWDEAFNNMKISLEKELHQFIIEEQQKAVRIAELSRIKMLG